MAPNLVFGDHGFVDYVGYDSYQDENYLTVDNSAPQSTGSGQLTHPSAAMTRYPPNPGYWQRYRPGWYRGRHHRFRSRARYIVLGDNGELDSKTAGYELSAAPPLRLHPFHAVRYPHRAATQMAGMTPSQPLMVTISSSVVQETTRLMLGTEKTWFSETWFSSLATSSIPTVMPSCATTSLDSSRPDRQRR